MTTADSFPRQWARTQRLTLGEPRNVVVSPDGKRVVFARSRGGDDPVNCLWVVNAETGEERLVADPLALGELNDDDTLPGAERARRERLREGASGITGYATDRAVTVAAFTLGGRVHSVGLFDATTRVLATDAAGSAVDPRPAPDASRVAYVSERSLRIAEPDGTSWELAGEDDPDVSWGSAEFVAAEEMGRLRGYWWSPNSQFIAACRVDVSPVQRWYIGNPAEPAQSPAEIRYPAAGTENAVVTLHVLGLEGGALEIEWDAEAFPYLCDVSWADDERLLVTVQSRDQRRVAVLEANPATGDVAPMFEDRDERWVELVPGSPTMLDPHVDGGQLVVCADRGGARRILLDGQAITPPSLQVRSIVAAAAGTITFVANGLDDPTVTHVHRWQAGELTCLTSALGDGLHSASTGGATTVIRRATLDNDVTTTVSHELRSAASTPLTAPPDPGTRRAADAPATRSGAAGGPSAHVIASFAERPLVRPNVTIEFGGGRSLATAVLLPHDHDGSPLPVLLDPYGGPHAQRVVRSRNAFAPPQWFADQGFAVVVIDGRGTPGRGTEFERAVYHDLATPVLDDQVDALHDAAQRAPLDLSRVAIRGWSFGGYLAALAVLRRPDVFHAAIAGAPVTDWRLYDTHYTERYLGDPFADATPYAATSLLAMADELTRPLLLIHGLADDNVVAAHTLQLSQALLAAGRPHEVLPLVGVTHMTPQEVVAEHLLLHQLAFLRRALVVPERR